LVNEIATSFVQELINHAWQMSAWWEPGACGVDAARTSESGRDMKHEAILEGQEWLPRDTRVDVGYDVRVHCEAGEIPAQLINLSSDGFRLHSTDPLQVGWEVTLKANRYDSVKAVICWASGLDAGGVFAEPVAL
jgi:hypothetical protein